MVLRIHEIQVSLSCHYCHTFNAKFQWSDVWSAATATENTELMSYCAPVLPENLNNLTLNANYLAYISVDGLKNLLRGNVFKELSEHDKLSVISTWIRSGKENEKVIRQGHFQNLICYLDLRKFSSDYIVEIMMNKEIINLPEQLM